MVRRYTKNKLMQGWGVNDVDYNVTRSEVVNGRRRNIWVCPYYMKWKNMLQRCLCPAYQARIPTYKNCTITEEWKYLSNFIKWVDSQPNRDWQNCSLDKDILLEGNKHYSPETSIFISSKVNSFIVDSGRVRGDYMIGVSLSGRKNKPYFAGCNNPFESRKVQKLGRYATEIEAHKAWQAHKHSLACLLADQQSDERVAKALRERYAPDKDWTKV